MIKEQSTVIIRRAPLTSSMFIEEFAILDKGTELTSDNKLPDDKYCTYYRVGIKSTMTPIQYINDHIVSNLTKMAEKLDWEDV